MSDFKPVGSVENAIAILNLLAISRSGLRLLDISQRLSINNSTCLALLRTLARHDAVKHEKGSKLYSIGNYVGRLNDLINNASQVERVALEMMTELAKSQDVIVTLWEKTDQHTLTLKNVFESDGEMRIAMQLGLTRPIYYGSIGRMFAAYEKPSLAAITQACSSDKWQIQPSPEIFMREAEEAYSKGWAADVGFAIRGMCSITVPLLETDGTIVRCCSAGMFQGVYDNRDRREAILAGLNNIRRQIELRNNSL